MENYRRGEVSSIYLSHCGSILFMPKVYDRQAAMETLKAITALGYTITKM